NRQSRIGSRQFLEGLRPHSILLAAEWRSEAVRPRKDPLHPNGFAAGRTCPDYSGREDGSCGGRAFPDLRDSFAADFPLLALSRALEPRCGKRNPGARAPGHHRIERSVSSGLESDFREPGVTNSGGGVLLFALSRRLFVRRRKA